MWIAPKILCFILCGKAKKWQNIVLGYKRCQKSKSIWFLTTSDVNYMRVLTFLFHLNVLWRLEILHSIFLEHFMRELERMTKCSFRFQKVVKIPNLTIWMCPKICVGFHLSEYSSDERNTSRGGGAKTSHLDSPPQHEKCQFEGLCLSTDRILYEARKTSRHWFLRD